MKKEKGYELGLTSIQFLEPNLLEVPDALGVAGLDCYCCTVWVQDTAFSAGLAEEIICSKIVHEHLPE